MAVAFCYINNITFFAACIAINERRVKDNRHFMTCRRIQTKELLKIENKPKTHIICCGGRPPRNREEAESFVDKFPRWLFPKIVLKLPFKIIIIVLFIGYIIAAIYGCVNIKQGLLFTQLVSDDSYFFKYSDWEQTYFKRSDTVSFVIPTTYEYSKPETQALISELISTVQADKYFDNSEVNWLKTYMNSEYFNSYTTESDFISGLKRFLSDQRFSIFENDVIIDSNSNRITSSRVYAFTVDLEDSQEEGKMMLASRDLARAATINCFAFAPSFVAYEQYVRILDQTLLSVGIALVAVFIVACIFMPHPVLIIFVTIVVMMIMIGVFGFIYYIDVALSAITMINMIMSIGFSVDFTAHICHGYMISNGASRDTRVKQAIDRTGAPIFHGAISSLLGILILVVAKSYIFRSFAAVMAFVLLFGIAHALLLLPVILSWIGPGRLDENKNGNMLQGDNTERNKQQEFFETDGTFINVVSTRKVRHKFSLSKKRNNEIVLNETNAKMNDNSNGSSTQNVGKREDHCQIQKADDVKQIESKESNVPDANGIQNAVKFQDKVFDLQDKQEDEDDKLDNEHDDEEGPDAVKETDDDAHEEEAYNGPDPTDIQDNNDNRENYSNDGINFKTFASMYNLKIDVFSGRYSWQKVNK